MNSANFCPVVKEIKEIIEREEPFLLTLDEKDITAKFNNQNRSIKQIVGHMIDSATNNIHRFIHLQYGETPLIYPNYATNGNNDRWIKIQNYQEENWHLLVQLWKYLNFHIIHVIKNIDSEKVSNEWIAAPGQKVSLKDMVFDYPRHLKLHMKEIYELIIK